MLYRRDLEKRRRSSMQTVSSVDRSARRRRGLNDGLEVGRTSFCHFEINVWSWRRVDESLEQWRHIVKSS